MRKLIIAAFAMALFAATAVAQNNERGNRRQRVNTTEMYTRMADNLIDQMKLDKDKRDMFKLLYLDYQNERQNALNPRGENNDRIDLKKVSDEEATELIEKQLKGQEAQLAIDRAYLPKFLEFLTPKQAAYIYVRGAAMRSMMGGRGGFGGGMPMGGFPGGGMPMGGFPGGM